MRIPFGLMGLVMASCALAQVPSGGSYSLSKQVIASGGGRASGGSYVLTGTIGQSAAGRVNGGSYTAQQGFHGETSAGPVPDPIFQNGFE